MSGGQSSLLQLRIRHPTILFVLFPLTWSPPDIVPASQGLTTSFSDTILLDASSTEWALEADDSTVHTTIDVHTPITSLWICPWMICLLFLLLLMSTHQQILLGPRSMMMFDLSMHLQ